MLTCLDLFSGIGGFSLGLERTGGFKTIAFCEIDPFCRAVLAQHWPNVPCHDDVRYIGEARYWGPIDVVTGGVPCQPASVAGKRKGSSDERWLWPHFLSVVRSVKPLWVLAENPRGIISLKPHGLAWIERELHAAGYETQCFCIGADDVGAPHQRKRVWIVAHNPRRGQSGQPEAERTNGLRIGPGGDERLADADIGGRGLEVAGREAQGRAIAGRTGEGVAYAKERRQRADGSASGDAGHTDVCRENLADTTRIGKREQDDETSAESRKGAWAGIGRGGSPGMWPSRPGEPQHEWEAPRLVEFQVGQPVAGIPEGVVRTVRRITDWSDAEAEAWYRRNKVKLARANNKYGLRALGNAIVPQVAELIGRAILAGHSTTTIRSDA